MAKYHAVDGIYRKVAKKYTPVEGVYRNVTKAFEPVDGVYRQYFSSGVPAETLAVGDSVYLNLNGYIRKFLVVHQGNPDPALYDESCSGTWLMLAPYIYDSSKRWDAGNNDYEKSDIHAYLNSDYLALFDDKEQSAIKQVKIPYVKGTYSSGSVASGANGLSTKIFLLSIGEVGGTNSLKKIGACLDYFATDAQTKRIFTSDGSTTAYAYYLRNPHSYSGDGRVYHVGTTGAITYDSISTTRPVRPVLILDSNTPITQDTKGRNIIA